MRHSRAGGNPGTSDALPALIEMLPMGAGLRTVPEWVTMQEHRNQEEGNLRGKMLRKK